MSITTSTAEKSSPPASPPQQRPDDPSGQADYRKYGFIACLTLLLAFTLGSQFLLKDVTFKKKPVYLQKPLPQIDQDKLLPYKLRPGGAMEIKTEILDALGTTEYIQWAMLDSSKIVPQPEDQIQLFVTYYTDKPGQVPHVPEECYLGSGYDQNSSEVINLFIPAINQTVPVKVLTFERSAFLQRGSRVVMYTFHANGSFAVDRRVVRSLVLDPQHDHAYYSKLEITFGTPDHLPPKEKAVASGKAFLQSVIPVLVNDHWPDWEAVEQEQGQTTAPVAAAAE